MSLDRRLELSPRKRRSQHVTRGKNIPSGEKQYVQRSEVAKDAGVEGADWDSMPVEEGHRWRWAGQLPQVQGKENGFYSKRSRWQLLDCLNKGEV